jgi:phosphoribosylglycinamide formyltransferase-1
MQAVIDNIEAGRLDARVVLVVSNNSDSGALARARRHRLPSVHLSGHTHHDPAELDRALRDALVAAQAELVLLAGYMKRIGPLTLAAFRGRILNIHPALLPRHGGLGMYGLRPHQAVIAAGDTESGATVHLVTAEYDQGPALRQRRVPVLPGDSPETLQQRVLAEEHRIYSEVLADIIAGKIPLPVAGS